MPETSTAATIDLHAAERAALTRLFRAQGVNWLATNANFMVDRVLEIMDERLAQAARTERALAQVDMLCVMEEAWSAGGAPSGHLRTIRNVLSDVVAEEGEVGEYWEGGRYIPVTGGIEPIGSRVWMEPGRETHRRRVVTYTGPWQTN